MIKVLYLGIDPPKQEPGKQMIHCPLIQIIAKIPTRDDIAAAFYDLPKFTHVIFTSKQSVRMVFIYLEFFDLDPTVFMGKQLIAVGSATASILKTYGFENISFPQGNETAEGIVELMEKMPLDNAYMMWPHSSLSRPVLTDFFKDRGIRFKECVIYDTRVQAPSFPVNLAEMDEIVFTSPSTVDAYLKIFGPLPKDKVLTPIGPVTAAHMKLILA